MSEQANQIKSIGDYIKGFDLFGNERFLSAGRKTERGELMRTFLTKLNESRKKKGLEPMTMPRLGQILEGIPTQDLYILEKKPDNFKGTWSQYFYTAITPKKGYTQGTLSPKTT